METEQFIHFLERISPLSITLNRTLRSIVRCENYRKGLLLSNPGMVANTSWFLYRGLAKEYYFDARGKQVVTAFWMEGELMLNAESFFGNESPGHYLELLEDCRVVMISRKELLQLSVSHPEIHSHGYHLLLKAKKKSDLRGRLLNLPTRERLVLFRKHFPWGRITGVDTASFLSMSREQLARLRSESE